MVVVKVFRTNLELWCADEMKRGKGIGRGRYMTNEAICWRGLVYDEI